LNQTLILPSFSARFFFSLFFLPPSYLLYRLLLPAPSMLSVEYPLPRATFISSSSSTTPPSSPSPTFERLAELKERVATTKRLAPLEWDTVVNESALVTGVRTKIRGHTRAYHKLREIFLTCALEPPHTSVHLCEAPGAFVLATRDYVVEQKLAQVEKQEGCLVNQKEEESNLVNSTTTCANSFPFPFSLPHSSLQSLDSIDSLDSSIPPRPPSPPLSWTAVTLNTSDLLSALPREGGTFLEGDVLDVQKWKSTLPCGTACLVTADGALDMDHSQIEIEHLPLFLAQLEERNRI